MFESVLRWWCRMAHRSVFHPMHGKYICGVCLREWPVPWAATEAAAGLKPERHPSASPDVIVTSPERGLMLIRLPLRSFRSASANPAACAQAGNQH